MGGWHLVVNVVRFAVREGRGGRAGWLFFPVVLSGFVRWGVGGPRWCGVEGVGDDLGEVVVRVGGCGRGGGCRGVHADGSDGVDDHDAGVLDVVDDVDDGGVAGAGGVRVGVAVEWSVAVDGGSAGVVVDR